MGKRGTYGLVVEPRARHLLVELTGCDAGWLNDIAHIRALLRRAVAAAGATPVAEVFHPFAPQGVTGVVVLEESHLSIHTWPETGYAALDFYTCGSGALQPAVEILAQGLGASRSEILHVERGRAPPESPLKVVASESAEWPSRGSV